MSENINGRFILTILRKIGKPIEEAIDIFDGVYIAQSVEVLYETNYNARDKRDTFRSNGCYGHFLR